MIRFVDVRFQGMQARFALWDTVCSEFISLDGEEAWSTLADFETSLALVPEERDGERHRFLERVRAIAPPWASQPPTDEELDFGSQENIEIVRFECGSCNTLHVKFADGFQAGGLALQVIELLAGRRVREGERFLLTLGRAQQ